PNGYRFDTGPTLITMPFVFETLFRDVERTLSDYVTVVPLESSCRYFFPDGSRFNAYSDIGRLREEIKQVFPGQGEAFDRYFKYAEKIYRATEKSFIYNPLSLTSLLKQNPLNFFSIDAFSTAHAANARFFSDKRFVQLLDRFPTYVGSSPYLAPATLNVIPYVELAFGGHYVKGGLYRLAEAYQTVCEELGVRFEMNAEVEAILIDSLHVRGVRLQDGREFPSDAVVSNDDAVHTYQKLVNANGRGLVSNRTLDQLEASCSGFVLCLGIGRTYPELGHHNIFFSADYEGEFDEIFQKKMPPSDPTIYVSISAKSDSGHAPEGKENWFVLINAPYLTDAYDWNTGKQAYRNLVIERLKKLGFADLEQHIEFERIVTPLDLKRRFNTNKGSIYGVTSNKRSSAFLRPRNRSPYVKGLYLATGSAHPGGGTPMVTLSGKFAADLLMEDFGKH
ncbi:MAG: phytoene desaturase, partial [Chlorobiales bacterium]|nr:phytoene desaturase [Chlorobiales bacterium]